MKTLKCVFVLLAFAAVTFLGCSDQPQSPVAPNANDNTVTSLMKPGSGAWIVRYESNGYYYAFFDADAGLLLTLGLDDVSKSCGGGSEFEVINIKDIFLPNADPNLRRIVTQEKADNYTAMIWQAALPFNYCDLINNNVPLATGTAKYIYNDNDYLAWMQDNKNANAFGYKANGTLEGLNGKVYKLNFLYHFMWNPDNPGKYNEVFKIQLTPTGK